MRKNFKIEQVIASLGAEAETRLSVVKERVGGEKMETTGIIFSLNQIDMKRREEIG